MEITVKQYAQSLIESVKDKNKKEIKQIIQNFVKVLSVNNDISKGETIILEFNKLWNKKNNIIDAKVVSANEIAKLDLNLIVDYIKDISKAQTVNVKTEINKNLLGGVVLKYGDRVLDGSIKTKLNALNDEMKN